MKPWFLIVFNPDCSLAQIHPSIPLCEHPLRGLPAYPTAGGLGALLSP